MGPIKAIVVCSGGMDSVTLAHLVKRRYADEVIGIGFNYGQRHYKELGFASQLVGPVLASYTVVDITNIQNMLGASVLTDHQREVPEGMYDEDTMRQTVVPNRNMIMISIAAGYAVTVGATAGVFVGVHGGDHFVYPDCRPAFTQRCSDTLYWANRGFIEWIDPTSPLQTPFIHMGKHDIVTLGAELGDVDYSRTWSCYKGGDTHCGKCGTCTERKEAFRLAQVADPTDYEDPNFKVEAYRG